jgi:hypothetical protein
MTGQASSPDGDQEHLFVPLADEQPELAQRLIRRFSERWVAKSQLHPPTIEDAVATVELKVAHGPQFDGSCLRHTSFYSGSTYWHYGWDGTEDAALEFMDEMADTQSHNVAADRRHGPTPWDYPQRKP